MLRFPVKEQHGRVEKAIKSSKTGENIPQNKQLCEIATWARSQ
jgi:hypothetical protein